jgi:hypothetical protein
MTKGAATCHHGRPVAADATAAPVRSKKIPTWAQSFNNGKCGRRIAIAARIFQAKKKNADNASVDLPKIFLIQLG